MKIQEISYLWYMLVLSKRCSSKSHIGKDALSWVPFFIFFQFSIPHNEFVINEYNVLPIFKPLKLHMCTCVTPTFFRAFNWWDITYAIKLHIRWNADYRKYRLYRNWFTDYRLLECANRDIRTFDFVLHYLYNCIICIIDVLSELNRRYMPIALHYSIEIPRDDYGYKWKGKRKRIQGN